MTGRTRSVLRVRTFALGATLIGGAARGQTPPTAGTGLRDSAPVMQGAVARAQPGPPGASNGAAASPDPTPLVARRGVGAQRAEVSFSSSAVDAGTALGPLGGCSVARAAATGAAVGAVLSYFAFPVLGHNTRQHVMWSAAITGAMAGSFAWAEAVHCRR